MIAIGDCLRQFDAGVCIQLGKSVNFSRRLNAHVLHIYIFISCAFCSLRKSSMISPTFHESNECFLSLFMRIQLTHKFTLLKERVSNLFVTFILLIIHIFLHNFEHPGIFSSVQFPWQSFALT